MKILASLFLIFPMLVMADHGHHGPGVGGHGRQAQVAAAALESTLKQIDQTALEAADEEHRVGHHEHEADYDKISELASEVARELHRRVIRGLIAGEDPVRLAHELENLKYEYGLLNQAIGSAEGLPPALSRAVSRLNQDWDSLERALHPRLPMRATCRGRFGGNFFNKKSHVECTVVAGNPTHYEVVFSNPDLGATETISGTVTGNQFSSAKDGKASVGRSAQFVVYFFNRRGERVEVSNGVCTGNPF